MDYVIQSLAVIALLITAFSCGVTLATIVNPKTTKGKNLLFDIGTLLGVVLAIFLAATLSHYGVNS